MPLYSDLGLYYTSHLTATPSYYSSPFLGSSGRSPTLGLGLLPPPRVLPRVSPILPSIPESSCFSTSRTRTALDRSPASRYIPPPPSASRYKPLRIDTADIDVSSNRYSGLSSSHALGSEPDRQNTIKRGRTVVRLHTKKFKENPTLDAKRKMTPGEKLMQKFLILDKAEEEAKAARRKRLEEMEMKEREEAEVARLQAMAAAKSAARSSQKASDTDSVDSSSTVQNFAKIGGMTENAALDILLSATEDDEPVSGGEITRTGSTGTVKKRKSKDREGTVKLAKKKTKRRTSVDSTDAVQSPAEDITNSTPGDDLLERSTLQRRNTVRFRRNSQDTEAFPEVESIAGSRRSSIDPGSRRSSFDQVVSDSRRSSLDSTTGDEITQPNEKKSTVKKRKGPKNRIVVANISIDNGPTTSSSEPPSPKFIVDEVKVEQSASARPVGKTFRYEVIVEDIEGEKTAPKHGKSPKSKGGPTKKKKSSTEKTAISKSVDNSSSGSSTDIEAAAKGENKDSTLKSFQKSHDAKAEGTVKQNAKTKTEENKGKSKEMPKTNMENLKSQKSLSDDNEFKMKKTSKHEVTLEKENENYENISSDEKHGQRTTQDNKVLSDKTTLTQKSLPTDPKQKSQANIEKKKDPSNINKAKLEKTKQVKRQADPPPVLSSSPPETKEVDVNFWAFLNGSVNDEKVLRKPVLPKEQEISTDSKKMLEEVKSSLSAALNIQSDISRKESEEEKEAIKGVTEVRVIKTNKEANSKQETQVSKVDRKKKVSPKDKALVKQSMSASAEKLKCETKSTSSIPLQSQNLLDEKLKTTYSESLVKVNNDKNVNSLKTPSSVNSKTLVDNNYTHPQTSLSEVLYTKKISEEATKVDSSKDDLSSAEKLSKNNILKKQKDAESKTSNNLDENAIPKWKQKLQANKVVEQKKPPLAKIKQGSGDTSNEVITHNDAKKREKFSAAGDESKFSKSSIDVTSEQIPANLQQYKMKVKDLLYVEPEPEVSGNIELLESKKSFSKDSFKKDKSSSETSVVLPKLAKEKSEKRKEDSIQLTLRQSLKHREKDEENPSCSSSESGNVPEESTKTKNKLPSGNLTSKNEYLPEQKSKCKDSVDSSDKKSKSGEGNRVEKVESGFNENKNKLFEQKIKTEEKSQIPTIGKKGKPLEQTKKEDRDLILPLTKKDNTVEAKSLVQVEPPSNKKGPKLVSQKSKEENGGEVQPTLKKEAKLSPQKNKNDKSESNSKNNCAPKIKKKNSAHKSEGDSSETSTLTKTVPKLTPSKSKESEVETEPASTIQNKNVQKSKTELLNDDAPAQKTKGGKKLVAQKSKDDIPKDDKITQKPPIEKKLVGQKSEDDLKKTKQAVQKGQPSSAVGKKLSPKKSKEDTLKDTTTATPSKTLVTQKSKEDISKDELPPQKPPSATAEVKKGANKKSLEESSKESSPTRKKDTQKSKDDIVKDAPTTRKSCLKNSSTQSGDVKPTVSSSLLPTAAKAHEKSKTPNRKSAGVKKVARKVDLAVTAVADAVANAAARAESGSDADSEDSSGDEGESTTPRNSSTSSSGSSGGSSSGSGTASSDSGFDSRPSSVPVSSTASEAGIGAREPGSPAPAYAFSPTLDPYSEDVGLLRGSSGSGRTTPPATSLPRFRKYTVDDFQFLKLLGKGTFGKVLLAELRGTDRYYAVKCLKKDVVLEDDDVECTLIERKVLALGTKHPYLCHLFCTFQTESHLLFVMEYLNGGDLMFHIQQSGRFPEPRARFYAAEIVCGLKFLHKKGIVYRDLKLDNILLDYQGHVRIADFGMCKLQIFLDRTADTFCGTPDYMAPEIIKGLKYNQCVDWWSFGVLVFEMLVGVSPFSGCDEDELFWSICNEQPQYPRFLSREAHSLLVALLEKDALKRLGTPDSPKGDVPDHLFFRSVDWGALERRELEPPFTPRVKHPLDVQYFDTAFTAERPELTPVDASILQSMDQAQFQGFSYTNPNATD